MALYRVLAGAHGIAAVHQIPGNSLHDTLVIGRMGRQAIAGRDRSCRFREDGTCVTEDECRDSPEKGQANDSVF
jgi:hypothetical protein